MSLWHMLVRNKWFTLYVVAITVVEFPIICTCKGGVMKTYYCILRGRIKGLNSSITTILFEVGGYRTVVG